VAKEAGFTTGALTHYFHSKDQVLIEASEYSAKLMRPRMERMAREPSAIDALRKVVSEAMPLTQRSRDLWKIWLGFWERSSYDAEVAKIMRLRYQEWRGRLSALLHRAQTQGEAPLDFDADLAAQELVALVDGIAVQVVLGMGRIPATRQRDIIDTWIESMIAGRAGRVVQSTAKAG
jgi:AcrR family transcriptional regulator